MTAVICIRKKHVSTKIKSRQSWLSWRGWLKILNELYSIWEFLVSILWYAPSKFSLLADCACFYCRSSTVLFIISIPSSISHTFFFSTAYSPSNEEILCSTLFRQETTDSNILVILSSFLWKDWSPFCNAHFSSMGVAAVVVAVTVLQ